MSTERLLRAASHGDHGSILVLEDWLDERGQRLSDVLTPEPETFDLKIGDGYGDGYGSGYGDGYGDGYGSGYGDGSGYGYGSGYGDGLMISIDLGRKDGE